MSQIASETCAETSRPLRPILLPRALVVGILNALLYVGTGYLYSRSGSRDVILPAVFVIMGYVAWVILRVGDVVRRTELHATDAAVCRHSGSLLLLVAVALVGFFVFLEWLDLPERTIEPLFPVVHLVVGFMLEVGTALGIVAVATPRGRLARPVWLWRLLGFPFLLLYIVLLIAWSFILVLNLVHM